MPQEGRQLSLHGTGAAAKRVSSAFGSRAAVVYKLPAFRLSELQPHVIWQPTCHTGIGQPEQMCNFFTAQALFLVQLYVGHVSLGHGPADHLDIIHKL